MSYYFTNDKHRSTKCKENVDIIHIIKWKQGFFELSSEKGKTRQKRIYNGTLCYDFGNNEYKLSRESESLQF